MLTAAPRCSSWVVINMGTSRRDRDFMVLGDVDKPYVWEANHEVAHVSWLLFLAAVNDVHIVLEQPVSSVMEYHPSLKQTFDIIHAAKVHTWLGAFGAGTAKSTF
eukprot:6787374-Karenia_brevis.AAC.1